MIDRTTIQRIMDAADIVEVISEYVTLRKTGASYKGKCPFHDDTTPSFVVTPSRGIYKCFACGEGGDVVTFLMKHNGWSYPEALKWLANKYGITIEENKPRANRAEENMYDANSWAANYFEGNLALEPGKAGKDYFLGRGFTEETIKEFRLGYALPDRSAMSIAAVNQHIYRTTLQKVGLAYKGTDTSLVYDRFVGRAIFPWINESGRVIAFGGRKLDAATKGVEQKYINSCESEIFSKSIELYGIYQAKHAMRLANHVYIVEGYTDVISMHQAGVKNVVACSGTAMSANHARLLKRFCNNVTLMFDGDEAGMKAAAHNIIPLLSEGMNVKVIVLTGNEDPDTLAKSKNKEELQSFLTTNAIDFIDFYTLYIINKETDVPARAGHITNLIKVISKIPDETTKSLYLNDCKNRFGLTENAINQSLGLELLSARLDRLEAEIEELKKKVVVE